MNCPLNYMNACVIYYRCACEKPNLSDNDVSISFKRTTHVCTIFVISTNRPFSMLSQILDSEVTSITDLTCRCILEPTLRRS